MKSQNSPGFGIERKKCKKVWVLRGREYTGEGSASSSTRGRLPIALSAMDFGEGFRLLKAVGAKGAKTISIDICSFGPLGFTTL